MIMAHSASTRSAKWERAAGILGEKKLEAAGEKNGAEKKKKKFQGSFWGRGGRPMDTTVFVTHNRAMGQNQCGRRHRGQHSVHPRTAALLVPRRHWERV
jgi:hypothetical protein